MLKYLKNIKIPKIFMDFFFGMGMEIFGYLCLVLGIYPKPNPNPSVCLGT
jgi:hypothetical protein